MWLASIFLVCELSDHSIILRKCTPGWQGCKIACKGELFFLPHLRGLPHLPGVPHLQVNRPLEMPVLKSHKLKTKVLTAEMNSEAKVCNRIVWVGQHYCKVWLRFYFSHLSGKICFSEESFWRNIAPDRKYEDWNTPGDATKYFPKYWWEAGTSKCHLPLPPVEADCIFVPILFLSVYQSSLLSLPCHSSCDLSRVEGSCFLPRVDSCCTRPFSTSARAFPLL